MSSSFKRFDLNTNTDPYDFIKTGIKGLDQLLGGGIPFNHLLLIEEDEHDVYANLLLRCLASNAVYERIRLIYFTSNGENDPLTFLKKLPSKKKVDATVRDGSRDMKIAFRYNYMPALDDEVGYLMDFGRLIEEQEINEKNLPIENLALHSFDEIPKVINSIYEAKSTPSQSHLIIIDHLSCTSFSSHNIVQLVYQLKSMARKMSKTAIVLTYQKDWIPGVVMKRLRNISDTSIQLESFDPLKPSVFSEDYKGALHVHKVSRVISAKDSLITDLGFQMKRNNRYFLIEKLFLPPDIGDTPSRSTSSTAITEEVF